MSLGRRIKYVERTGQPIKEILVQHNPWKGQDCGRVNGHVCEPGPSKNNCKQRSVVYHNTCELCKSSGRKTLYIGEIARSLMERYNEHL